MEPDVYKYLFVHHVTPAQSKDQGFRNVPCLRFQLYHKITIYLLHSKILSGLKVLISIPPT